MLLLRLTTPGTRAGLALGITWASVTIAGCSSRVEADRVPPPPVVSVVEARQMTVPVMAEPIGTTRALQEVSIRARVRGYLKEMHFKEGADVKKEQLLFVIDEAPFKAELDTARAKLEQAEAALKKAQDSKAREVATAQVALSRSMLELAEVEERREQSLYSRKASSLEEVQRKQAIRKKDTAQVDADKASLEQAKADYDTSILAAQADVAGAKARVVNAEIDLSYCRLSSPINGRIGLAEVKLGNLVGPATSGGSADYTELAVIRQLDPIGVDMQVASRYLDRVTQLIANGLPVEIYRPGVEGEQSRRFPGKATVIDNTIDATTSTFRVQAEVPNPQKTILPGEYVKAHVKVGEARDAVVVPEQAVIESQAGPSVYTVDGQGKVAVAMVKATFVYEGLRVLESGIQPGQKVVIEGLQLVRPGITVKAEPAPPEVLGGSKPGPVASADKEDARTVDKPQRKP
jgi:membrane fusion protein, multidrug efflux system